MDYMTNSHCKRERSPAWRPRKLAAPKGRQVDHDKLVKSLNPQMMSSLILRAGKEALRCAGRGWLPESDISVALGAGKPLLLQLAGFRRIELRVDPKSYVQQCCALHQRGAGHNPLWIAENVAGALVRLFAGYYDICPWDAWRHRALVRAAVEGAYRTAWVSEKEEQRAARVALFFERSLVSCVLTQIEQDLFVEGTLCERVVNNVPQDLLSGLFARCQSILFPKIWEKAARIQGCEPDPVADALLPEVMALVFNGRLHSVRGGLRLRGKTSHPRSWEWRERVWELAALLVPYLERLPEDPAPNPQPNPFGPDGNPTPPRVPGSQPVPGSQSVPGGLDGDGPHPFIGENTPTGGGPMPGVGEGNPRNINFEELDRYYSEHVNALVLRDKAERGPKRTPERLAIGGLGFEEATLLDLLGGRIEFSRTRLAEADEEHPFGLRFFRRTDPIEIPATGDIGAPEGLPHLLLVCDSSGSMQFNPGAQGLGRGKYDVLLRAAWGMFRYIQDCHGKDQVKVNALNFSNATLSSGWHPASNLEPVKRILAQYHGGGTRLDVAKLREAFDSRPGEFLAVAITDGQLGNTPDALAAFGEIVRAGNHLVLLHIGPGNVFTKGIEALGCPTHVLKQAEDLEGLCLDLARSRYAALADGNRR